MLNQLMDPSNFTADGLLSRFLADKNSLKEIQLSKILPFIEPMLNSLKKLNIRLNKLAEKEQNKLKTYFADIVLYTLETNFAKKILAFSGIAAILRKKCGITVDEDMRPFIEAFWFATEENSETISQQSDSTESSNDDLVFSTDELFEVVMGSDGIERDVLISSSALVPLSFYRPSSHVNDIEDNTPIRTNVV